MKKSGSVLLDERDVYLLKLICIFGYLSSSDVKNSIFHADERYVRRRLARLIQSGHLLKRQRKQGSVKSEVYCPNLQKLASVVDRYALERGLVAENRKVWNRSFWRHENHVRQWAIKILEIYPDAELEPDYFLLDDQNVRGKYALQLQLQLPDFILRLPLGPTVAVEIEKSHKTIGRYYKRFLEIMTEPNRPTLYLIDNEKILSPVQKGLQSATESLLIRDETPQSKILLCLFKEALKPGVLKSKLDDLFDPKPCPHVDPLETLVRTG